MLLFNLWRVWGTCTMEPELENVEVAMVCSPGPACMVNATISALAGVGQQQRTQQQRGKTDQSSHAIERFGSRVFH
jgi:hypothetical protein